MIICYVNDIIPNNSMIPNCGMAIDGTQYMAIDGTQSQLEEILFFDAQAGRSQGLLHRD